MSTEVKRRRGNDSEHNSFTGALGELTVNTTNDSVHVHDGSTTSGFELLRADANNAQGATTRAALGLAIGTDVQAQNATLQDLADNLSATAANLDTAYNHSQITTGNPHDISAGDLTGGISASDISDVEPVSATEKNQWDTAYAERGSQIAGNLLSWDGSELDVDSNLNVFANNPLTVSELAELQNIGTTSISSANWGHVAVLDQDLATTDSPTFAGGTFNGYVETDSFYDQRTNIGNTGKLSRSNASSFFQQPATTNDWAEIPMMSAMFVYNNDIDDNGNVQAGAPTERGYFLKVSSRDVPNTQGNVGWGGLWLPYSGENGFYVGRAPDADTFPNWFQVALHDNSVTFSDGTFTDLLTAQGGIDVTGDSQLNWPAVGNVDVDFLRVGESNGYGFFWRYTGSQSGTNNGLQLWREGTGPDPYQEGGVIFATDQTGNVGIGTTSPSALLDVNGLINASTIETDTLRTHLFKKDITRAMGGKMVFNASSQVISVDGTNQLTLENSNIFSSGDLVAISGESSSGFHTVVAEVSSMSGTSVTLTNYDSGSYSDIATNDEITKVSGDMIYINAQDGGNRPFIRGFENIANISDSPYGGSKKDPVYELRPEGIFANSGRFKGTIQADEGYLDAMTLTGNIFMEENSNIKMGSGGTAFYVGDFDIDSSGTASNTFTNTVSATISVAGGSDVDSLSESYTGTTFNQGDVVEGSVDWSVSLTTAGAVNPSAPSSGYTVQVTLYALDSGGGLLKEERHSTSGPPNTTNGTFNFSMTLPSNVAEIELVRNVTATLGEDEQFTTSLTVDSPNNESFDIISEKDFIGGDGAKWTSGGDENIVLNPYHFSGGQIRASEIVQSEAGGDTLTIGDSGFNAKIGFFGDSIGATKPSITGGYGGSNALKNLLVALDNMGLINDNT